MPTVRNIFCQNSLIRSRMVALMTALSKDSETSRTPRMAQRITADQLSYTNATTSDRAVTMYDHMKILKCTEAFPGTGGAVGAVVRSPRSDRPPPVPPRRGAGQM